MERNTPTPRWVGLEEAAEYANVSVKTLRRRISDGTLRANRGPGKSRLIRIDLNQLDAAMKPVPMAR